MVATVLEDAKCLLSSLSKHPHDPQVLLSSDSQQAHLILAHVLDLARSTFLTFINQGPPVTLDSPDWTVVKAVYEILVKWGIYPGLAAGVGIPPHKRFKSRGYVDAATAAVFEHVKYSNLGDAEALECGSGSAVFECAEFLVRVACSESSSASLLKNHVLVHHLPDVWAAYFQLGYGDMHNCGSEQVPQELRAKAIQRIEYLAMDLPVGHAIEALLTLLGQDAPVPPQWLKREVGKILSKLVMREGGVVAVLERLVGSAAQGDVSTYRRIAAHLAKCPKQVAEPELYFSRVCTQVLPYLRPPTYLKQKQQQSQVSSGITNNIHHTSVLLACSMAQQELELLNKYLITPLLNPVFKWMSMMDETKQKPGDTITEDAIIDCVSVLQVLTSAGHPGSKLIGQVIFERINRVMAKILALHFLLAAPKDQHESARTNNREVVKSPESGINGESSGNTCLKSFRISVADLVVTALKTQSPEYLIDIAYDYLLLEQDYIKWPNADSEISAAISDGHVHHKSPAWHLSEFFSSVETWDLAIKLMNKVFKRIVQLHKLVKQKPDAAFHTSTEFLKLTSYLEDIIEGVGSKAMEEDTAAVLPFVKDIIDDDDIMSDEDILELALHMIYQLLQKLIERSKSLSETQSLGGQEAYWASILSSLQRICTSDLSSSKAKGMASTLYNSLVEECVCSSSLSTKSYAAFISCS